MASLQTLYQAIHDLDTDPKRLLETSCYDLTQNNHLGFKDPADFHVGIPYNSPWPDSPLKNVDSTLKAAFLDVLQHGIADVEKVIKAGSDPILAKDKKIFIDITNLDELSEDFFLQVGDNTDHNNPNNLAHKFGTFIDRIPSDYVPIIRLLIGSKAVKDRNKIDENIKAIFWPGGSCVVKKHPKAQLCVGYYSPNFTAKLQDIEKSKADIVKLAAVVLNMVQAIKGTNAFSAIPKDDQVSIDKAVSIFEESKVVTQLAETIIPAISWNHAKILAVHGQTLLTGGGNYWKEYMDEAKDVSDLQCKIRGNASFSAHRYCDHLWEYLSGMHNADNRSWRQSTDLKGSSPIWNDNAVPTFAREHGKETGGKSVLAVAKLGDWVGPMKDIQYPIQVIDALRDVLLNIIYHEIPIQLVKAKAKTEFRTPFYYGLAFKPIAKVVQDRHLRESFKTANVTPAAWASRITRCKAIAEAKDKVYIDAEIIGGFLQKGHSEWDDWVKTLNTETLKLAENDHWNGVLWPFDLIEAIGKFMQAVNVDDTTKKNGVYILLTTPEVKGGTHEGWGDYSPVSDLKDRIKTLAAHKPKETQGDLEDWFNKRCHIKRISNNGSMYNHNKAYCVDEKLLYVGSDNPYPNYNEEHGVWIDDVPTIGAWIKGNWKPRWDNWAKDA